MPYCSEAELTDLWRRSGLQGVETGALVVEASYDDYEDYWVPFLTGPGPSGAYCASLDAERLAELHDAVHRRLGRPAGPFTLTARAWYVRGQV
jgi:hypothetical protein